MLCLLSHACSKNDTRPTEADGGGSDGEADRVLPHVPERCAPPRGTYVFRVGGGEPSHTPACTGPNGERFDWNAEGSAIEALPVGTPCTAVSTRWEDDGCVLQAEARCDGEKAELRCSFVGSAATAACQVDLGDTECAWHLELRRVECRGPLLLHDNVCHEACGPDEDWDLSTFRCTKLPGCSEQPCGEHGACSPQLGGYTCQCDDGYAFAEGTCELVDACKAEGLTCAPEARCEEASDGASCVCPEGYEGDGESCELLEGCVREGCPSHATCQQATDGHACVCDPGYAQQGGGCVLRSACAAAGRTCHARATCDATTGQCVCEAGYTGDGEDTCDDIDECAVAPSPCGPHSTCTNAEGSFTCDCQAGYAVGSAGRCEVADYCVAQADCVSGSTCANVEAGFVCACDASAPSVGCGVWADTGRNQVDGPGVGVLGFWFTAPVDMRIVAGRVQDQADFGGTKLIAVYRLDTLGELTMNVQTLGGDQTTGEQPLALDVSVDQGDAIGVIGYEWPLPGDVPRTLSANAPGPYDTTLGGVAVELFPLQVAYDQGGPTGFRAWQSGEMGAPVRGVAEVMYELR